MIEKVTEQFRETVTAVFAACFICHFKLVPFDIFFLPCTLVISGVFHQLKWKKGLGGMEILQYL